MSKRTKTSKKRVVGYLLLFVFLAYALSPWVAPSVTRNPTLTVQMLPGKVPTYEVRLTNPTPWPMALNSAVWLVTNQGIYMAWDTSEAPPQSLTLLPLQTHAFQFTIFNATDTEAKIYYSGPVLVELHASANMLWTPSSLRIQSWSNSTST
jgi:hypothetical protein